MAYTAMTVQTMGRTGTAVASVDETGLVAGHYFANDGETYLLVINAGAGACNITPVMPATEYGDTVTFVSNAAVPAATLLIPTNEHRVYGPFPVERFNHRTGDYAGSVCFTMDDATGVTVLAFK